MLIILVPCVKFTPQRFLSIPSISWMDLQLCGSQKWKMILKNLMSSSSPSSVFFFFFGCPGWYTMVRGHIEKSILFSRKPGNNLKAWGCRAYIKKKDRNRALSQIKNHGWTEVFCRFLWKMLCRYQISWTKRPKVTTASEDHCIPWAEFPDRQKSLQRQNLLKKDGSFHSAKVPSKGSCLAVGLRGRVAYLALWPRRSTTPFFKDLLRAGLHLCRDALMLEQVNEPKNPERTAA